MGSRRKFRVGESLQSLSSLLFPLLYFENIAGLYLIGVVCRIITRACTAKLKAYREWIEEWAMENMPHDPFLHQMPWKTRFIDGMEGPTYHVDGAWRSNRWMLV